jgi:hypothetical protein
MDQPPAPEEIEGQVRQIEAELARPARFTEPSAAERARKPRRPGLAGRVWALVIAVVVVAGLAAAAIELPRLGLHKAPVSAASGRPGRSPAPATGT